MKPQAQPEPDVDPVEGQEERAEPRPGDHVNPDGKDCCQIPRDDSPRVMTEKDRIRIQTIVNLSYLTGMTLVESTALLGNVLDEYSR